MATTLACSGHCGMVAIGSQAAGTQHWNAFAGTGVISIETAIVPRVGGRAYKLDATSAAVCQITKSGLSQAIHVGRARFHINALPAVAVRLIDTVVAAGDRPQIRILTNGTLEARFFTQNLPVNGPVVIPGVHFYIDWRFNMTTGVLAWSVDSVAQTDVTITQTATTVTSVLLGLFGASAVGSILYLSDILFGDASADYPFGEGKVVVHRPTRDGIHSFTLGDFKYNNSGNVAVAATDVWSYIDDTNVLDETDFISQNVIRTAGYVEVGFATPEDEIAPRGVSAIMSAHASGAAANAQTLKVIDGGSTDLMANNLDFSVTVALVHCKHYATAPSGGAWTRAKLGALLVQWGFSGDVTDIPFWDSFLLEVEYAVQVVVPNTTVAANGWLDQAASAANLHAPLADDNPATWDQSPTNPVNAILKVGLTDIPTPGPGPVTIEIDAEQAP